MSSINSQLADLTAKLCVEVAERLAHWSRNMETTERNRIIRMIEEDLPNIVSNTVAKSAMLHSPDGVKYLEENLDKWADSMSRKFIGKD